MKEHLFYTFLFIFIGTATITLLGITKVIPIDDLYLKILVGALLVELGSAVIHLFLQTDFFSKTKEHQPSHDTNQDQEIQENTYIETDICKGAKNSQEHDKPDFERMAVQLKELLVQQKYLPDLIIGIARGGLAVAGFLSEAFEGPILEERNVVPVISLCPLPGFDNSFNQIKFSKDDFSWSRASTLKILIVDDICRSGRTLHDAKNYIEKCIDLNMFDVETAAIYLYYEYAQVIKPTFYVIRSASAVRGTAGKYERFDESMRI